MDVEMGDSDSNSHFTSQTRTFLDWFRALPGATFHKDIEIVDLRGRNAGRGIVATADIEPDTVLFTIPRSSIICTSTSPLAARIPDVFDLDAGEVIQDDDHGDDDDNASSASQNSWTLLILVMIHQHLQGAASPWKPYLDVLPSSFDTPMFWSPSELSELQASAVTSKVGKEDAERMIRSQILPVIRANEDLFYPSGTRRLSDDELVELAHRMGSTIMAYAFDLEKEDEEKPEQDEEDDEWVEDREGKTMLGMVPMADILNADAEFSAHIAHGTDALTATALRTIRAGEEILNYYGPLSTGELLRRYGYVTSKHARYDVVELQWSLVQTHAQKVLGGKGADWDKVAKGLAESYDEYEEAFVLERTSEDPDASGLVPGTALFEGLPEELTEQFKAFLKMAKKAGNKVATETLADKDARKQVLLQSVLAALREREAQYGTSLEEDEQILNMEGLLERRRMAVWVRRGEKRLLREAQAWVTKELDAMGADNDKTSGRKRETDDGPAAKRQRK